MLVLSRKPGERIHIGSDITVTLVEMVGNRAKLGIEAPEHVAIAREELRNDSGGGVANTGGNRLPLHG
jgi:carbon storage regulator